MRQYLCILVYRLVAIILVTGLFTIFHSGCKAGSSSVKNAYKDDYLEISQVDSTFFIHRSYLDYNGQRVPCNGVIAFSDSEAIIIDTPTDSIASKQLIRWLNLQNKNIVALIPNHFHKDCVGGMSVFYDKGIKIYTSMKTFTLLEPEYRVMVSETFKDSLKLSFGQTHMISKFHGPGHTQDNLIHYFPLGNYLFGGCLIKSLGASKGNLADADTLEWSNTIQNIQDSYPDLDWVIPGHGREGGPELLEYTKSLFRPI